MCNVAWFKFALQNVLSVWRGRVLIRNAELVCEKRLHKYIYSPDE